MNRTKFIESCRRVVEDYGPQLTRLARAAEAGLTADEIETELEAIARKADAEVEFRSNLLESIDYYVILAAVTSAYIALSKKL